MMFYVNRIAVVFFLALVLSGCNISIVSGGARCTTVDNRDIDGSFGTRDVYRIDTGRETRIGYSQFGRQVLHSECAPARTTYRATETLYEWFEFGQPIEEDGILSLRFYTANNRTNLHAIRKVRLGIATEEFSDKSLSSSSTPTMRKAIFLGEFPFDRIEVVNNFDFDNVKQVSATIGTSNKTKRWNDNTQQYDCVYTSPTSTRIDNGCENEVSLDDQFLDQSAPLVDYFDALSGSFRYNTNESTYQRQLNLY
ncbi:hypothetical protein [Vibrio agarivorans]|uniref:hypothetical protein n=1 Tax=Vibrio agarivorans TaxID=153622 RepID=UPI002231D1BB|nr:hypothetical protein [Vibrio agarivorans]MDN3663255.1 hypothetical protein [Vibrio agarivorans]